MKTVPPQEIAGVSERLHADGNTIVFTHGVFDLLHPDLIDQFRKAAKLGTHLVVALYSDEMVGKIYGEKRSLIPLQDRVEVLAAMEMISYVTWFHEETPENLVRELRPDVIVKVNDDLLRVIDKIVNLPSSDHM